MVGVGAEGQAVGALDYYRPVVDRARGGRVVEVAGVVEIEVEAAGKTHPGGSLALPQTQASQDLNQVAVRQYLG